MKHAWMLVLGTCGACAPGTAPQPASSPPAFAPEKNAEARPTAASLGEAEGGGEARPATPARDVATAEPERPAMRAWFPESFLWMPVVETGPAGSVTVPVSVPDTLTTWRVLGLGWSTTGAVGGAETSFRSTLPAYVDVVLPRVLYAGDRLRLPVQAVNQTAEPIRVPLTVTVRGRTVGDGAVALPPWGSATRAVRLDATTPGSWEVSASLGALDAVSKSVEVRPGGRPVRVERGGTLAAPRELVVDGVAGASPGDLVVTVFPGALGVVGQELDLAADRGGGVEEAAYVYALAGRATPLVQGGEVDPDRVRDLQLLALQRLSRPLRAPEPLVACAALPGVRGAEAYTPAGRLAERLVDVVERGQQPDGLWTTPAGTPTGRALVATARCAWALGPEAKLPRARAASAFSRFAAPLEDPRLSAWAVVAGLVEGEAADAARTRVRDALETAPDGTRRLPGDVALGVGQTEATALAALALADDTGLAADLAAGLLAGWTPGGGFGDGTAGLVALAALEAVMGGEVPGAVRLRVTVDGQPAGEGALDPTHPHRPVTLRAPGLAGTGPHTVAVAADPPVPGLAFTLVATSWLPWTQAVPAGLDLRITVPPGLRVGRRGELRVEATGPAGEVVNVDLGLPAGVEVDRARLAERLSGVAVRAEDGVLHLEGLTLVGGRRVLEVPVVPALAGTLASGPSTVRSTRGGDAFVRVPSTWIIE